ncbi:LysR substrate-binding domain-containing protein [Pararhodobacter oceanensis]|uniref:LysR family transcriptional regulator n=1 Tax=Pararhodobacter oceanensis TaxID=2172121 RepID=A0A2T8HTN9_9RHOB|nr:LysR substrate-binding domain-containing protein [Pararhodobacter oceanensis]PVH28801.1 LysR family transcriptional regulator [Pararhodobacter oceanensis]
MLNPGHLPLNAMRAFEVAARTGSFKAAGVELGVSAAAVSQQVKALEQQLDKQLFHRLGNRISLTDAGRTLYPSVDIAFTSLRSAARSLQDAPRRARVVISALPSLCEHWLMPLLRAYPQSAHLDLHSEEDPVDLARAGIDLRLAYGAEHYPDHVIDPLFTDHLVAVAARATDHPEDLQEIPDAALIHTSWGRDYGIEPDWAQHFEALGLRRYPDQAVGLRVASSAMALSAARIGLGVALAPSRMVADALCRGELRQIGGNGRSLPRPYVLVMPNARARNRAVQDARAFLLATASEAGGGVP